tara:strand:- start:46 stop:501 length:456 start_codon:yes stop_codon:yes gene_type:complete
MFLWTVATLALAAVASANNLHNNNDIIKIDSNTDFGEEARNLVYNALYSGDIPGTIPNLVNTTSVDSIQILSELDNITKYLESNLSFVPQSLNQKVNGTKNLNKYMKFISKNANKIIKTDMKHTGPFQKIINNIIVNFEYIYDAMSFNGLN